jgi:basic amino acid/polyamine antiporter, APA family
LENCLSVQTKPAVATTTTSSSTDREFLKGLGLTSSTMLVMGSMIGSGIFLVSAEIAREVDSPALLIGAWLITGFLTIVGALTYGEFAKRSALCGDSFTAGHYSL